MGKGGVMSVISRVLSPVRCPIPIPVPSVIVPCSVCCCRPPFRLLSRLVVPPSVVIIVVIARPVSSSPRPVCHRPCLHPCPWSGPHTPHPPCEQLLAAEVEGAAGLCLWPCPLYPSSSSSSSLSLLLPVSTPQAVAHGGGSGCCYAGGH